MIALVCVLLTLFVLLIICGFASFKNHNDWIKPNVMLPKDDGQARIVLTYKREPPKKVFAMLKKYAPEFKVEFFDDKACEQFLKSFFKNAVVQKFNSLKQWTPAHAADLFRFCALAVFPGRNLYLDVKTVLQVPVVKWFPLRGSSVIATTSQFSLAHIGIVGGPRYWKGWSHMIDRIMITPSWFARVAYHTFCYQFYTQVADNSVIWLRESCLGTHCARTGIDRYNLCCVISNKQGILMHSRDPNYPY